MLHQVIASFPRAIGSSFRFSAQVSALRSARQTHVLYTAIRTVVQPSIPHRWYSDESKPPEVQEGEEKKPESEDPTAPLRKEIEAKTKEILELKDKYLRSVADFRNLQDRTAREVKYARDFAIQKFAKDLADSVDNLDRALDMVPQEKLDAAAAEKQEEQGGGKTDGNLRDLASLYSGIKMTETILMQTLKNHGLERFDPGGLSFNPNEHEATFHAPMPDKEHNTVFHTQQKGFKLHGRVLRPAKVGVVKNK